MPKVFQKYKKYLLTTILLFIKTLAIAQSIEITSVEYDKMGKKNREEFKKTDLKDTVRLKPNQNFFKIFFKTSNLKKEYSYQLFGFETFEIVTNNDFAYYTNVSEGEYDFVVRHTNNKNISAKLHIIIESPFYLQWWFAPLVFLFVMIVLSVIIYLIFLYRFSQKMHLQKVRNDIASDLHDDIGATLSSISFFGEMMRNKVLKNAPADEVLPLLEKVISTSKETIQTMRGVVWTINPNNDNATDFFQKLHTFGKEMLAAKNIELNFEATGFENQKLPLHIQRNLFLFYKETINNIAKHSQATFVEVNIKSLSISGEGFRVRCLLEDNGKGFNINDLHEGHGLKSLRKRADELQGNLEIKSSEGAGTTIILSFPLE